MPPSRNGKRKLILLRHADKKGRVLSEEGHEKARFVGETVLRGMSLDLVVPSLYARAIETAVGFLRGMRDGWFGGEDGTGIQPHMVTGVSMEEWIKHLDHGEKIEEIEAAYPEFMKRVYTQLRIAFEQIVFGANVGKTILVVTHDPCLQAAVRVLTRTPNTDNPEGTLLGPMGYCEGVVLEVDDTTGEITFLREIRHNS